MLRATWYPVMGQSKPQFLDEPPQGEQLTAYDREHMVLYLRLLDAHRDGADWREATEILFGIDPASEPERSRKFHDAHLARAQWMTERGYQELLRKDETD